MGSSKMKKMLAGLVATFMMLGLVAGLSAGAANADTAPERYQNTVPVSVSIKVADTVKKGHPVRIGVRVEGAGNGNPDSGHVTIRVTRVNGGYRYLDVKGYDGGTVYFTTTKLPQVGKYSVRARFDRSTKSVFMDGNNVTTFKVVR